MRNGFVHKQVHFSQCSVNEVMCKLGTSILSWKSIFAKETLHIADLAFMELVELELPATPTAVGSY